MATFPYNQLPYNNRNTPFNPEQDQVALFIDWDNLVISNYADRGGNRPDLEVLVQRAKQYGTVVIARAYAEWNITADRLEVYKSGIEPIYAPVFHADRDLAGQTTRGKSLADPVMVTDCIDFLHLLPQVGTYILVTGDKDMVPVVRLARLRGRRVVVIGPDYVANVLQQVSDEFIPYRFLLAQVVPTDPYAAYYQQTGQTPFYPQQTQPSQPLPQGYYPPQMPGGQAQPIQPPPPTTDRRGRRLTGRRGQSNYNAPTQQPYARVITPPPNGQPGQQPGFNYGTPGQGYQQPNPNPYQQPPVPGYPVSQPPQVAPGFSPSPNLAQPASGYTSPQTGTGGYTPVPPPVTPTPVQPESVTPVRQTYNTAPVTSQPQSYQAATPAVSPEPSTAQSGKTGTGDFNEVKEAIRQIIALRTAAGRGQMRARDLKEELLRRIPNFSERRYGFSKFKALLSAAEAAGVLQIDQSGHILWVSAPGTPKMQFNPSDVATDNSASLLETDSESDSDEDEEGEDEAASPATQAELEALDGVAIAPEDALQTQMVEPSTASITLDDADFEPVIAEERTTSLVEAPIGAHRERPSSRVTTETKLTGPLGERPALLDQEYYEDVILLVDSLRNRNRWLGYELLLSNVRDYLTKTMPESDAKVQAGNILSKLLNDGIIKMAIEVHSRGARKMTVKVAHLQENNPAVRYVLESRKAQAEAPAQVTAAEVPVEEATYADVDLPAESLSSAEVTATAYEVPELEQWGGQYTKQAHTAQAETAPVVEDGVASLGESTPVEQSEALVSGEVHPEPHSEHSPDPTVEEHTHPTPEVNGHEVQATLAEGEHIPGDTGSHVHGEPSQDQPDENAAPAGGYINTVELEAHHNDDQSNGHNVRGEQPTELDGKQTATETLQPVAELDGEESDEVEVESEESEAEGDVVAAKVPSRRPRRRRTTPVKAADEGQGESMSQPRPRLDITQRPHRRPRSHK